MHRSRLGNIIIDCNTGDLLAEARFWSQALGYPLPEKIDGDSPFIQLQTPPGEVQVIIQRVQHEARAHLDIDTDSITDEVTRLERLGATVVTRKDAWVVMQAPSGHRFCVGSPYRAGFYEHANHWSTSKNGKT
ncbi:VOC family protein [Pseudomonas sp. 905_Psudmo1]|nr:VOC family protein [Pseudomonas sp. 905_Psudmo1]WFS20946.1 VOC family protein [Pseudomonas sp. 905_Psudmo1]